jgi:adenylyltransferase/sulfurtransferase
MLSEDEIERYQRHILLRDVGGPGQQKLKRAKVLVIGAGGLGSPVLLYLAAAGVGTLGVIDDDTVALSNLQRQVIHTTDRVGTPKTESAAATIAALNPHVEVRRHTERLTAENALEVIGGYDIVADGCDNFATRFLVNDACYFARVPLVSAAVGQFEGQVTTFRAYETGADGNPNPSYRCLIAEAPPPGLVPTCEEAGILGALVGIIGSIQALEVMKEILDIGRSLTGRLLIYDALEARMRAITLPWNPDNPLNGRNPTIRDLSVHARAA